MQITIRIFKSDGSPVKLTGELGKGSNSSGMSINGARLVDVEQLPRAEYVSIFDRNNKQTTILFNCCRIHTTRLAALKFAMLHNQEIPVTGLVQIEFTDAEGSFSCWFNPGAVDQVDVTRLQGVSTWHTYRIIGGEPLANNPNT